MTYTVVTLELSRSAYDEVHRKMVLAGYDQAVFKDSDGIQHVDMKGIAITRQPDVLGERKQYASWKDYDQPDE
jgi:hypothetical protein